MVGENFSPRREYVKNSLSSGIKKKKIILIYMCAYLQIQQDLLLLLGLEGSFNIIFILRKLYKGVCIYE